MKLNYQYSEREFITAMNQNLNLKRLAFDVVLAVGLLVYGFYLISINLAVLLAAFLVALSVLFVFMILVRIIVVPRVVFRREPKYREEYELVFQEDEILFTAGGLDSIIKWDFYKSIRETKDFIYLIYSKNGCSIIPKRAFQNNEEQEIFIKFVRSKICK
ncbi:YcxB family protein [Paenibacillus timonensis]|uniref:YcxB family protein n=1 Tax=Paenibacillus timonensis TaxID=225915 RepID=A0ABW3SIE8_9BACL|nr:YcxB family protein [Paenibacillus timonensis]MCH1643118.1 YcxB family protein [Paenibacillus timonensis]GJM78715.1 hypothetical protein HMSSN139_12110 [Paenibacillus sp. HMSSN-139]